ncbi:MAG: hypothetical protein EHM40_10365 [Chloroflexi bacterium]|nr:MAG: hypothetical protein EHM40_10365 [Chloroflexota bacterium]
MVIDTILWRRLDAPGHDACRLEQRDGGWQLDGTAVFRQDGVPARLTYQVKCDPEWHTQEGTVQGWVGGRSIDSHVRRTADGMWMLDGQVVPHLSDCVDLDLGFTPATNLFQLRRVALQVGQVAAVPVAWLDLPATTLALERVAQRYERRAENIYWYESPRFDYAASLEVRPTGFIHRYPDLWEVES